MSGGYTGTDNLEVMREAVNYNRYLVDEVGRFGEKTLKLFDFGAGIGTFAEQLREEGYEVVCIEPDSNQLERIRDKGFEAYPGLNAITGEGIEFLYSLNVLEHIESDRLALRDIFDRLKKGGRVLLYVPAFQILYSSMDERVGHYRRYRKRELEMKLEEAGFEIERARYADSLGFFASLAFKWFGSNDGSINKKALVAYDRFVFPVSCWFDKALSPFFGKNLLVVAKKPGV